jgi:hypothetical protein
MRNGCEKYAIDYIVGIAKNSRLLKQAQPLIHEAQRLFDLTGHKQRLFGDLVCAAGSWRYARRIIAKAEHSRKGANPRFVVTNMAGNATELCDQLCCARGEAENRSKEQQLDLFRRSHQLHELAPNQLRVLLSGLAYTLMAGRAAPDAVGY